MGAVCENEWDSSFNATCNEEADFMAQLLGNCSPPNEVNIAISSSFWRNANAVGVDECSPDETNTSLFPFSLQNHESYLMATNSFMTMEGGEFLNSNNSIDLHGDFSEDVNTAVENETKVPAAKKRTRASADLKRSKKPKKCDENGRDCTMNTKMVPHRQTSSSFCSEDDSYASSHEVKGATSSVKARANKGSATDPQSLYARKRRERINERLRILQNLVPNGTKVDISTMLEEAVQYVKFLQLQIKLLSSDELWMYAPLAYNGMNLSLDFDIPTPKPQSI